MPWIRLPRSAGRDLAALFDGLLPEIERMPDLLESYAGSPDLRKIVFDERRRLGGRTFSFLCRVSSYDLGVVREIWDQRVYADGLAGVRSGDTVIDVGAHGGFFAVLAASKVGSRGRVLAIEPEGENVALLRENLRRNRCTNVRVVRAAASRRGGVARLTLAPGLTGHSLHARRSPYASSVRTVTLDRLAQRERLLEVALLKIDAEAAELDILRGAARLLPHVRTIVAACYHTPTEAALVRRFLARRGFRTRVRSGIVHAEQR